MNTIKNAWNKVNSQRKVWDHLRIENHAFYYQVNEKKILLSHFADQYLPKSPYELTFLGKILTKLSVFSNIMSKRPGTEEVTFYSLINKAQGSGLKKVVDEKILKTIAPPLNWRRGKVVEFINELVYEYTVHKQEKFAFIDIGCGGGLDSLEIERILTGLNHTLEENISFDYKLVNVDIDEKWLKNNEELTKILFGKESKINRYNMSVFEYFDKKIYEKDFKEFEHLIVSCNGFAEFFEEENLKKLYEGIHHLTKIFKGQVDIILPFAITNQKQEKLGNAIGFKYRAKEKKDMLQLVEGIFKNFKLDYDEAYSQMALKLRRKIRSL